MRATRICVADEIAGAAEMVMGKASGVCVALVRGVTVDPGAGSAAGIARPPQDDLFR
jgi:coenzyme F420-0:L-glutamate ligase/coenzyme F420-1:gamma-L-glutamate ligase